MLGKLHNLILVFLFSFSASSAFAQDKTTGEPKQQAPLPLEQLVLVEDGTLPIIISAPHGGTHKIVGVEPRKGEGMEKGARGFFTGRDGGTQELAAEIVSAIETKMGARPFSVISAVDRKYLDPNRPDSIAYESPNAKPVYDRYHNALERQCRTIVNEFHVGLLLDIHGQGSKRDTVFRGTNNGKTVKRLRESFGDLAHAGDQSLFGLAKRQGWTVYPDPMDGKEQAGFTGGYIVQSYGSHQPIGIDAIQLEFGAEYRTKANRKKVADQLAEVVAEYAQLYLRR